MMKIKSSASVVVRIVLWCVMLFGGLYVSITYDVGHNSVLFSSVVFHGVSFVLGFVLMRLAFRAAAKGGKALAKDGRDADLPRLETNRLVTSGIYASMRHPMLFGLMLVPLALALLVGSPTFIFVIAPLEMLFIAFMVLVFEEMECKKKFDTDYEVYAQKVPMVCVKRKCLRELFGR